MKNKLLHAFCIWLCVYPVVTFLLWGLDRLNLSLASGLKSLLMTVILVPLIYFFIVPFVGYWLTRYRS